MKRIGSTKLGSGGPVILVVAGINLFLLLCMCVLLGTHVLPRYGVNVRPAASHFVMSAYDRSQTHLITISAGMPPCYYLEGKLIPGGLNGVEEQLNAWDCASPARVVVLLVADDVVPSGDVQRLADRILLHGFTCMIAARPDLNSNS